MADGGDGSGFDPDGGPDPGPERDAGDDEPTGWPVGSVPLPWRIRWIGDPPPAPPPADAAPPADTAPPDAGPDAPADAAPDAQLDAAPEVAPDGAPELAPDGSPDLSAADAPHTPDPDAPAADASDLERGPPDGTDGPMSGEVPAAEVAAGRPASEDDRDPDPGWWAQAQADGPRFALRAGGTGVGVSDAADQFLFVEQPVAGDATLVARVRTVTGCPAGRVTFGVMLRASLAPGAPYVMAAVSGTPGATLQARRFADYYANVLRIDNGVERPLLLRVRREGTRATAGYSRDGQIWQEARVDLSEMGPEAHFGLVASSHRGAATCAALFESVVVGP